MLRNIASALTLVVALAACATGTTTSPTPAGPTLPDGGGPQPTAPQGGPSTACAAFPTFGPDAPTPSFPPDNELLAKFPATVDGEPIENPTTVPFLAFLCAFGAASVDALGQALAGIGFNLTTASFGSFGVVIDTSISVQAIRAPGADANALLQNLDAIGEAFGTEPDPIPLSTATIGGKTVYYRANGSGSNEAGEEYRDYFYASGDTLWTANGIVESQANKLFPALP